MLLLADGIADTELTGIEKTDDVARVGFLDRLPFRRKELLRLGETEHLAALAMQDGDAFLEDA